MFYRLLSFVFICLFVKKNILYLSYFLNLDSLKGPSLDCFYTFKFIPAYRGPIGACSRKDRDFNAFVIHSLEAEKVKFFQIRKKIVRRVNDNLGFNIFSYRCENFKIPIGIHAAW